MLMRLLRSHLRPYGKTLLLIVALQTVQTTAALTLPTVTARIIDDGVLAQPKPDIGFIHTWGGLMVVVAFVQVVFAVAAMYYGAKVAMSFGRDLRKNLFHQVTDFSAREVGTFGVPSLITRITNDVQQVQMLVVMACTMAIAAPITMVVGVILAVRQDIGLSIVLVIAMPVAAIVLGFIVAQMVPAFRLMQERIDQVNRVLREQITGIRVVRAFVREPARGAPVRRRERRPHRGVVEGRPLDVVDVPDGQLPHQRVERRRAVARREPRELGRDPSRHARRVPHVPRPDPHVGRDGHVHGLDDPAGVGVGRPHPGGARHAAERRPAGQPRARRRPTRRARVPRCRLPLSRAPSTRCSPAVSFATAPGQTTAIVGSTGAGKSTLVNLILRLFDSTEGTIKVGGVDVHDLDPDVLWQTIGLVPQRPYLFSGTVASNLEFGKPDATEEEMWTALEVAQATDFVRAMPGGLNARIEQGGTNVSGGQRQRLSIARALIRRPDIYVFDDSFSALDLATDARLRAALGPYTKDSAVVIVAQRVSTIATADNILVLEDGVVDRARDPRRAHPRQPDVRRDRPEPDRREERGMTLIDDQEEREELDLAAPEIRAAGPLELGRCSRRAVEGLQERAAPPGPDARADVDRPRSSSR